MPYVALQQMLDEANGWGLYCYDKGCYVEELSDGVIDALVEHFPKKTSPLSITLFYRLDNAYSAVSEDATAFSGGRSPRFGVFIIGGAPVPEMFAAERDWVRSMGEAMRPYAASDGSYVNGSSEFDAVVDALRRRQAPPPRRAEGEVRPTDLLHGNARVAPTG